MTEAHPADKAASTETPARPHFESIDLLRGFAAISVVIYHVIEHFGWSSFPASGPLVWFRSGWMGVDLFFVISGLVIGLSAFTAIDRNGSSDFRKSFALRRIARIAPLHYLTLLVFVAFISPEVLFHGFGINLLSHLTFVHNLKMEWHGAINGSNWSLGTEMQFYVLMLLIAPWLRTARWWLIALTFIGISWTWRFGVAMWMEPTPPLGAFHMFFVTTQLPGMLDEFLAGILIARLIRSDSGKKLLNTTWTRQLGLFAAAVSVTLVCMVTFWMHASYWNYPIMVVFWRTWLALAFALIILFTISLKIDGLTRKLLAPLYYLGQISYGIYLWHLPVLIPLKKLNTVPPDIALLLILGLTCLLASASWHFFEQPILKRWREV